MTWKFVWLWAIWLSKHAYEKKGAEVKDSLGQTIDMMEIVGHANILFVCIDCLRYDVAHEEEINGKTPVLNQYGKWQKRQAPGNFTYPSHQAMFSGFFPVNEEIQNIRDCEILFFPENIGMGKKAPAGAFGFSTHTWIEALANCGYETYCIGGVGFFDKRTAIGNVFPGYFKHSYWNPSFGCAVKESAQNQTDFALKKLKEQPKDQKIMMYINYCALHYPNYFYIEGAKEDSVEAHKAALQYVDTQLGRLLEEFSSRGDTFVICLSDHGTCYGEDGVWFHCVNHPIVLTVPYKHFLMKEKKHV